jgi:hypothetical protein
LSAEKFGMTFANFFDIGAPFLNRNGSGSTLREKWAAHLKSLQHFHIQKTHQIQGAPHIHQHHINLATSSSIIKHQKHSHTKNSAWPASTSSIHIKKYQQKHQQQHQQQAPASRLNSCSCLHTQEFGQQEHGHNRKCIMHYKLC